MNLESELRVASVFSEPATESAKGGLRVERNMLGDLLDLREAKDTPHE